VFIFISGLYLGELTALPKIDSLAGFKGKDPRVVERKQEEGTAVGSGRRGMEGKGEMGENMEQGGKQAPSV